MRPIKFRGKRVQDGKWVFWDLETRPGLESAVIHQYDENGIQDASDYVDKDTIGQFTGLTDKNGQEIYEGDLVMHEELEKELFEVVYEPPHFCFRANDFGYRFMNHPELIHVVTNIHDYKEHSEGWKRMQREMVEEERKEAKMANRKVYLLTEEQMQRITTKLSAMSLYVGPDNGRTVSMTLDTLFKAETIQSDEPLDKVIDKLFGAMKEGGGS